MRTSGGGERESGRGVKNGGSGGREREWEGGENWWGWGWEKREQGGVKMVEERKRERGGGDEKLVGVEVGKESRGE